jgi:hypothetical protein
MEPSTAVRIGPATSAAVGVTVATSDAKAEPKLRECRHSRGRNPPRRESPYELVWTRRNLPPDGHHQPMDGFRQQHCYGKIRVAGEDCRRDIQIDVGGPMTARPSLPGTPQRSIRTQKALVRADARFGARDGEGSATSSPAPQPITGSAPDRLRGGFGIAVPILILRRQRPPNDAVGREIV